MDSGCKQLWSGNPTLTSLVRCCNTAAPRTTADFVTGLLPVYTMIVTSRGYDVCVRNPLFKKKGVGLAVLGAVSLGVYLRFIRPWQLRWGATDDEVASPLPGDADVPRPTFNATRAVTISARPEDIWPWLIQIGVTRAGWYSYDLFDNLGHPSAERIIPEFQHLAVGDVIPMSPDGKQGQWVKALEPNRWMLWEDKAGDSTWYWGLDPVDERQTRLITRVRMRYNWTSPMLLFDLLVEFADIVMMRKCMLGIKRRAERANRASGRSPESIGIIGDTWRLHGTVAH